MLVEELRQMKEKTLDKYIKGGKSDKSLKHILRQLDSMIKRKMEENDRSRE